MMRVIDKQGHQSMTTLPSDSMTLMGIDFFEIVVMDPVGHGVDSDIGLTHFHPDGYLRG
jgi:hypothetical protein